MRRDPGTLGSANFDLLVVGGGILGCAAAWHAAARGLRVALIEQGDFGAATSANSLKIIHGGFRYLQHAQIRRMRDSIVARREFLRLAPHLVRPFRCLVPAYGFGLRSRPVMAAALAANALIGWDRNKDVDEDRHISAGGILSLAACRRALPDLPRQDMSGAAWWCDAFADNTERLTLSFALSAAQRGATIANYVRATRLMLADNTVEGIEAVDELTGGSLQIRAKTVVLATGPWRNLAPEPRFENGWLRAFNIVVRKKWFDDYAVGLEIDDPAAGRKRNLFFAPWRDGTMIGTSYRRFEGLPESCNVGEKAVAELLRDVNATWPAARLSLSDVTFIHLGILPAAGAAHDEPLGISSIVDHRQSGGPNGLITALGVKYTTGLVEGRRIADLVSPDGKDPGLLYGGEARVARADIPRDADVAQNLLQYGTRAQAILALTNSEPDLAGRVAPGRPVLRAEIAAAARDEWAVRLSDVVLRRTTLGSFDFPGVPALQACADIMAREHGWEARRTADEIADVQKLYYTRDPI